MPWKILVYTLEANSFTQEDSIETDIVVEEIETVCQTLKLGQPKGADSLNAEDLLYIKYTT